MSADFDLDTFSRVTSGTRINSLPITTEEPPHGTLRYNGTTGIWEYVDVMTNSDQSIDGDFTFQGDTQFNGDIIADSKMINTTSAAPFQKQLYFRATIPSIPTGASTQTVDVTTYNLNAVTFAKLTLNNTTPTVANHYVSFAANTLTFAFQNNSGNALTNVPVSIMLGGTSP